MYQKAMILTGLNKQRAMLQQLIHRIETKNTLTLSDWSEYQERSKHLASNLRKLRRIKSDYFAFSPISC